MFTGIVQGLADVVCTRQLDNLLKLTLQLPDNYSHNLQTGASIAVNGTCLTVVGFTGNQVEFDVIGETLKLTNLSHCQEGEQVNFERAARFGDEIGGHLLSGHITATVRVLERLESPNNCTLWLEAPAALLPYLMPKGFVALNGCSLTIGEVGQDRFSIHLIPETLTRTTFGSAQTGTVINLEPDPQTQTIVDTVNRYLAQHTLPSSA